MIRILLTCSLLLFILSINAQTVSTLLTKPNALFEAITWLPDGRIYTVDFASGEVFRLDIQGNLTNIGTFAGSLGGAYDQAGNFYFSEYSNGRVIKVDPSDATEVYATGFLGPSGILIDDANQVMYVANYDGDRISKVDMTNPSLTPEILTSDDLINGPDGLVFSPEGDIISANFDNNTVQKISPTGEVSLFAELEDSPNSGYLIRRDDSYIIAGFNGHRLFNISLTGEVTTFAGTGTAGYMDGPVAEARFNRPNGIAISPSGDSLLIAESSTTGHIRLITGFEPVTNIESPVSTITYSVFPNPINSHINFSMYLPQKASLHIQLLDRQGALIETLLPQQQYSGRLEQRFSRKDQWASGLYFVKVAIDEEIFHRAVVFK